MSYNKTVWKNNQAPAINADNLNNIENGIANVDNRVTQLENDIVNRIDNIYTLTQADIESMEDTLYTFTDAFKEIVTSGKYILEINGAFLDPELTNNFYYYPEIIGTSTFYFTYTDTASCKLYTIKFSLNEETNKLQSDINDDLTQIILKKDQYYVEDIFYSNYEKKIYQSYRDSSSSTTDDIVYANTLNGVAVLNKSNSIELNNKLVYERSSLPTASSTSADLVRLTSGDIYEKIFTNNTYSYVKLAKAEDVGFVYAPTEVYTEGQLSGYSFDGKYFTEFNKRICIVAAGASGTTFISKNTVTPGGASATRVFRALSTITGGHYSEYGLFGFELTYLPYNTTLQFSQITLLDIATKQDTLVSGTNIKTIDGNSVLGSGNIDTQNIGIITLSGDSGTLTSEQKVILQNKPVTFIVRSDIVYTLTNAGGYTYYFQSHQQSATADTRKVITINASSSTYTWTYTYYTYTRNPMTTTGDMIKGSADGTMTRLPKGTAGQFLKSGASDVEWADVIPTVTIDQSQIISQSPVEIQLTNEQYDIFANNKQVKVDVSAFNMTTFIWNFNGGDFYHFEFKFITENSDGKTVFNTISINLSDKIARFTSFEETVWVSQLFGQPTTNRFDGALLNVDDNSGEIGYTRNLPILTTAPSSANTEGGIIIVVLSQEPATKYSGYLYLITGA